MAIKYSNNARSTLAASISTTATTISVVDTSSFPSIGVGDEMYLTLSDNLNSVTEIVKCIALSGSAYTVVRAHENTTALAWPSGTHVQLRVTAGLIENLLAEKSSTAHNHDTQYDPIGSSVAMAIALGG